MLKYLSLAAAFISLFSAAAYDLYLSPTVADNVYDQVRYVMPERGIFIPTRSQVECGQVFHLHIAVGIKEPLTEPLKLKGAIQVKNPDGSVKIVVPETVMIELPSGAKGIYFAGKDVSGEFEKKDRFGVYEWTLTVKDASGGVKSASAKLNLAESISDNAPMDRTEFSKFIMNYYRQPQPERIMAALRYFMTEGDAEMRSRQKNYDPRHVLQAFVELFKLNKQFHDDLARATSGAAEPHRLYYALIFAGLGKDAVMAQKEVIDPQVQVQIGQFAGKDPLAFKKVVLPAHLDMLWAEFFITGRFAPVQKIVDQLHDRKGINVKDAQKKVKSGAKLTADEQREVMEHMIQIAAAWSLGSNLKKSQLLGYYMETVLRRKLYKSNDVAVNLVGIIKQVKSTPRSKK
ncbi:MAG: hypothetical protein IKA71_03965 [Lentisphaeria bacterium]|nr:hypothetical protein [Lentisphaeria bacterium]